MEGADRQTVCVRILGSSARFPQPPASGIGLDRHFSAISRARPAAPERQSNRRRVGSEAQYDPRRGGGGSDPEHGLLHKTRESRRTATLPELRARSGTDWESARAEVPRTGGLRRPAKIEALFFSLTRSIEQPARCPRRKQLFGHGKNYARCHPEYRAHLRIELPAVLR